MNRKYSQDIDKEILILFFKLAYQRKASFIASLTSITVFSCANIKRVLGNNTMYHWNTGDGPLYTSVEISLKTRE